MGASAPRRVWRSLIPQRWRERLSVLRQQRARRKKVDMGDLRRITPIELHWGRTRGGPIDRLYIEQFLDRHRSDITGRVLEVADPGYAERFGVRVDRIDVLDIDPSNPRATIVADITHLHVVPDATFDCIVCTQVLQLVYDVRSAFAALERVLAPGGILLATLPGILRTAPAKPDFWRFTALSARALAEEAFADGRVEVETYGNVLSATAFLYGLGQDDLLLGELDTRDPAFEVTVAIRACKAAGAA